MIQTETSCSLKKVGCTDQNIIQEPKNHNIKNDTNKINKIKKFLKEKYNCNNIKSAFFTKGKMGIVQCTRDIYKMM